MGLISITAVRSTSTKMQRLSIQTSEKIHQIIFGHSMSQEMRRFLSNLSWSFLAGIIVLPLMMLLISIAGRLIGPSEFGKYSLIVVISQLLVVLAFFGLDTTTVKYLAKERTEAGRRALATTNGKFVLSLASLIVLFSFLFAPMVSKISGRYGELIPLAAIFTFLVTIKLFLDLLIRGSEQFKLQMAGKLVEVAVVIILFALFFLVMDKRTYWYLLAALSGGAVVASLFYFRRLAKLFRTWAVVNISGQLAESKLFFVGALLGTLFLSADRILIGQFLDLKTLGIYSAYYLASLTVVAQATQLFTNVFFPASARVKNKSFAAKIDRLLVVGFVPLVVAIAVVAAVIMAIFGREYPLTIGYLVGFSLLSALYFFQSLYNTVLLDSPTPRYRDYLIKINTLNLSTVAVLAVTGISQSISLTLVLIAWNLNFVFTLIVQRDLVAKMRLSGRQNYSYEQ